MKGKTMSNFTIDRTPAEMRAVAATMVIEADRLEEKILRDSGRQVLRAENSGSRTKSGTGRYWLGVQTEKKTGFARNFTTEESGYSHNEAPMTPGQHWEDDEYSQTMIGLFELISERYDARGNRIGLYAECLTNAA